MTIHEAPRDAGQRKRDVLERLENDEDAWVSTADERGAPCLVPLSFVWHGGALLMSTKAVNATARNLRRGGAARIALGHTRDVVLVECDSDAIEVVPSDALPRAEGDAFAAKLNWDPRGRAPWVFLRFRPCRVLAWREENELAGREVMRGGTWLV
ncbi:pyridoxamine 5'-phosphate oxidase family protein [Streptomyces sp. URMC 123]|uniref:pyridoxamine 5'-phosphate oxidase family protein n=1 Tax=Streptomyces sp. URMC 123 TaxID=3423403 RepID=UPI003F1B599C